MSNWTHVAGVVRIDNIEHLCGKLNFSNVFGKECLWDSSELTWNDASNNPEKYLPMGSEGSLQMSVWENPDKHCASAYVVNIFGDLRDHDNPQEIIDWFKSRIQNLWIRQAVITVDNEWNGTLTWVYDRENN
jgi:hypothetical protein